MAASSGKEKQRLTSLDAFRGATMALMVLVNTPGSGSHVYGPLQHAEWHGWTPTDVVFPSFVWIVGVALTISLGRKLAAGVGRAAILRQAFRRAAILFLLGLLVYAVPQFDLSTQRILGVLQRIAICYAVTVPIYIATGLRGQIAWIVLLLAGYWALMAFVPVPGYGAGHLDVERNFAHYIDRIVLGVHNYAETKTWDPEGIVSTIPAIATMLLGVVGGHIVTAKRALSERTRMLLATGILLTAAGLICDRWLPINKKLWTSSFTLFMAGLDFLLFSLFLWIADGMGYKRIFQPFAILGMNAIAIYLVSEAGEVLLHHLGWKAWIFQNIFLPLASPMNASLLYALTYTFANFLVAWALWRKQIFFRV
jgi:predicted acyltransferase